MRSLVTLVIGIALAGEVTTYTCQDMQRQRHMLQQTGTVGPGGLTLFINCADPSEDIVSWAASSGCSSSFHPGSGPNDLQGAQCDWAPVKGERQVWFQVICTGSCL